MGLRATSITKYEVEYGGVQGFNYDPDTLANIIGSYCGEFYSGADFADTDVIWEIDKRQFADMIAELESLTEEEFDKEMADEWQVYHNENFTKSYVLNFLKGCLTDTQEDSNYVRIGWL